MKSKILFFLTLLAALVGCKKEDPELEPNPMFTCKITDLQVEFINQSTNAQTYLWEFGDGTVSSETNPIKTYSSPGTYMVKLKATNISKSSSYSKEVTISFETPKAMFSYVAEDLKLTFTNQSTNANSYVWDFGNGKTSLDENPTIQYSSEGTYLVSLTATRGKFHDTYTQEIVVAYKTPKAKFTYKIEHPLKVVLSNSSTNASSFKWEFGDGKSSTEKNPTHRYDKIGVYRVKLTAKNGTKTDVYETNVTVEAPTKCFLTGFSFTKIPTNNNYYQFQLTDDYTWVKTTYVCTDWYLVSSANISETHNLANKVELDISETYVARLYKSASKTSGQASGEGFWTATITSTKLSSYPETLSSSGSSAGIKLYFLWK